MNTNISNSIRKMSSIISSLIFLIVKIVFGVELKKQNFTTAQLPAVIVIVLLTAAIVVFSPFLQTIDNLISSTKVEGINYLALSSFKMSFITTPLQLVLICFFREIKNPLKKFADSFKALLGGFVGVFIMVTLMQNQLFQNLTPYFQFVLGIFPILTMIIVRLAIREEFCS